jgi:hypothetical protein
MMFSGLGNESLSARKIMLQCLCMHGAGWTAAPTDVLCVLELCRTLSSQHHLGAPTSLDSCSI